MDNWKETNLAYRGKIESESQKEEEDRSIEIQHVQIKRKVGLLGGISFIVGIVIGSGIFISPKGITRASGSIGLALVNWTICGIISLLGALCYAELGTVIPESGGEHVYLMRSYGNLPAYLYGWAVIVLFKPASQSAITLTCAEYILVPLFSDGCGKPPELHLRLTAITIMFFILAINIYSTNLASSIQIIFTFAKVLALVIIIIGGVVNLIQGKTENLATGFEGSETNVGTIALGLYQGMWAYDGWNNLNFITEEIKNPTVNLPLSICIASPLVIIVYLLTNISYFTVMSVEELLASPAVAVTWAEAVIPAVVWIIPLSVAMSTFGAANGSLFTSGRIGFAAARERHMPQALAMVNVRAHTPVPSLVFTVCIAIIYTIIGNVGSLIDYMNFARWIFYGLVTSTIVYFRYKRPDAPRPLKAQVYRSTSRYFVKCESCVTTKCDNNFGICQQWSCLESTQFPLIIPIIVMAASIFLVVVPIASDPQWEFLYASLVLLAGVLFYVPFFQFKLTFPGIDSFTKFVQLSTQCLLPDSIVEHLQNQETTQKKNSAISIAPAEETKL